MKTTQDASILIGIANINMVNCKYEQLEVFTYFNNAYETVLNNDLWMQCMPWNEEFLVNVIVDIWIVWL